MDIENIEEKAAWESNSAETFSSNGNVSNEKSVTLKKENQSRRSKKPDDHEANFAVSAEEILDPEVGKLKQQETADNVKPEVEPKLVKEEKKRSPKKRTEKKAVENTDTKGKQDNEENSNQKRKGWWSLKG